jgi:hypothetical protein
MEAWRGNLERHANGGSFRGPAAVEFMHLTSKFRNRGPYGGPTGVALRCVILHRVYIRRILM